MLESVPAAQPPLPTTAFAILGLLAPGTARTAYEVAQLAGELIAPIYWAPAMSAVYTELQRLETLGYVRHELEAETETRSRRVYGITSAGRAVLGDWIASDVAERTVVKNPTLLRVLFGAGADPAALVSAVEGRIAQARDEVAELERGAADEERHHALVRTAAIELRAAEITALRKLLKSLA